MINKEKIIKIEEKAVKRYNSRFKKKGVSPTTLGWGSKEDQLQRFEVITNQCNLDGKTVMDVGCGFADLFSYLNKNNININYIGIDIVPDFIDYCKEEYPQQEFYCKNVMLDFDKLPKADIVIALGILNYNFDEVSNFEYSKLFIKKIFQISKEKVVIDFLSKYRTEEYPKENFVYYHSPEKVFKFMTSLTNDLLLAHNYQPIPQKEFMIFANKNKEDK
ncbi:class I SAM-dependent methyltransferase [Halanaerocella petrolearia]